MSYQICMGCGNTGEFRTNEILAAAYDVIKQDDSQSYCFRKGARWQFEQDGARIGLAEKLANELGVENAKNFEKALKLENLLIEYKDYNRQLEARLAESERELEVASETCTWRKDFNQTLQDKLSAAEARVSKLEDHIKDLHEIIQNRNKELK